MRQPVEESRLEARGQSGGGRRRWIAFLIVGLAAIGAIVLVVVHIGDIGSFAMQAARAEPRWLAAAALVQLFTYGCVAGVWARVLRRLDHPVPLVNLYPLALAKMVSDQAAPSGGVAGAAFLFHALGRRGAPYGAAFTVFSFTAITFLAAFILAATISLAAVATLERASPALTASIAAFSPRSSFS